MAPSRGTRQRFYLAAPAGVFLFKCGAARAAGGGFDGAVSPALLAGEAKFRAITCSLCRAKLRGRRSRESGNPWRVFERALFFAGMTLVQGPHSLFMGTLLSGLLRLLAKVTLSGGLY
jgi:hypothetical protein